MNPNQTEVSPLPKMKISSIKAYKGCQGPMILSNRKYKLSEDVGQDTVNFIALLGLLCCSKTNDEDRQRKTKSNGHIVHERRKRCI